MSDRRNSARAFLPLVTAASVSYAGNAAFGAAVALGVVDNRRIHWLHHALYVVTSSLTTVALAAGVMERRAAGLALLPAVVPPHASVPVLEGRMQLGTWQRICLVDTNTDNPQRHVRLSFLRG